MALQSNSQLPPCVALEPYQVSLRVHYCCERLLCQCKQALASNCVAQATAGSREQRQIVVLLEGADLMRQRTLSKIYALGGCGKFAGFGDGHEGAQVTKFNHGRGI